MTNKQKIREQFRDGVFTRDKHTCKLCGAKGVKMDAHHITNREAIVNQGYVKENGITLCDQDNGCHHKVEDFYFTEGALENDTTNKLHPNNLYKLINSSYEQAVKAASKQTIS